MSFTHDLIVIGAGPAGASAAIAASGCGVSTLLVDDGPAAGGQIYRAPPRAWRIASPDAAGPDFARGESLRAQLSASSVQVVANHSVWSIAPGFEVHTASVEGDRCWRAPRLLVCAGVTERIFPFPGWTTPGVTGLAAATNLLKAQQVLPGRRTLVAGSGPLVYAVAAGILEGGGRVVAIADLGSRSDWLSALPALAGDPELLARGLAWRAKLSLSGVPVHYRHRVAGVLGGDSVTAAEIAPVLADGSPVPGARPQKVEADSVVVGHGLVPAVEVTRLLRANHRFDAERGGWLPVVDGHGRSSVPGLYAAGDCTGVAGAKAAPHAGAMAGLAVAHDAGRLDTPAFQARCAPLAGQRARAERFGSRMSRLMAAKTGLVAGIGADTIVCRCEDVALAQIEAALDAGASDCNEMKAWTRCGMGPCQGRTCGEVAAELVARRVGGRKNAGTWTARVPIRPQPIDRLAPTCAYDEIWNSPAGRIATAILPAENTRHMKQSAAKDEAR
jgi:NADPH-dependent 2,4-dienoyl-CoA reductase/sulfur reductase-like enzyme